MPRQACLDAPDTLHHAMVRGLERRVINRDDEDRSDFVARLTHLAEQGGWTVYAWALLPNHAHLLVRTGQRPLPRSMRSVLTRYAGVLNRRHHRGGHLFQNRYKSVVVEEEPYLLELVRYLHLNPLRAKVVRDLRALDRYPWTGHSAVLGTIPRPWQDTRAVLTRVCRHLRLAPTALPGGGRRTALQRARAGIAYLWVEVLGHTPAAPGGGPRRQFPGGLPSRCPRPGDAQRVGEAPETVTCSIRLRKMATSRTTRRTS